MLQLVWIISTTQNTHTKKWFSMRSSWILIIIRDSHNKEEFIFALSMLSHYMMYNYIAQLDNCLLDTKL